ncbi:ETC complex I subunit conserved region-domain-containing protein, partial [Pelagophyceae sp. CCMP2097]
PDHHYERTVLIQQRPRSPMQRCRGASNAWRLTWQNEEERWSNPLMGWTSSADPMGCVQLKFDRAEEAVRFCEKKGWKYELREP